MAHCSGDAVVWIDPHSKVFYFAGTPNYGHTKRGAYSCEPEASKFGFKAAEPKP
jgi:hypothetical protein